MDFPVKTVDQLRDHLRSLRREAKLTQKALGALIGLGQVRVAEIELNPGSVSTEQLIQVLQALGAGMVIRPKTSETGKGAELSAHAVATSKATGTLTTSPAGPPTETVARLAQRRLRELLNLSDDQAARIVTDLFKRGRNPSSSAGFAFGPAAFKEAKLTLLDPDASTEVNHWREALDVDERTFAAALRDSGVLLALPVGRNQGAW